ncbi:MAG: transposase, partial [Rikenellaceae bacterium]
SPDKQTVVVHDCKQREIKLREVQRDADGDYFLEINSPTKALKESSMSDHFKSRFEAELQKSRDSLSKKGGKKNYERVIERVGRAIAKYPSIARHYEITYVRDEVKTANMADIKWRVLDESKLVKTNGLYFLRTNIKTLDEKTTWDYYNLIREIESTNRQLKTDLQLRPIYHQQDDNSDAHLFFGLLAYWVVNTIRYQLKRQGINHYWTEIVRIMSTQKAVTMEATNALGERVRMRVCSRPTEKALGIYKSLGYSNMPFRRMRIENGKPSEKSSQIKVCSTQP